MLALTGHAPGAWEKNQTILRRDAVRLPWAWDGLSFATAFHEASRDGMRDVVNNIQIASTTGLTWTRDNKGNPVARMTTTSGMTWTYDPRHQRPSSAITALVRFKCGGAGTGSGKLLALPASTTDSLYLSWMIETVTGGGVAQVQAGVAPTSSPGSTEFTGTTLAAVPTTEYATIVLRWRTAAVLACDMYGEKGNLIEHVDTGVTFTGPIVYSASPLFGVSINTDVSGTANGDGWYSQALVWDRRLTDNEIRALCVDPFGWFAPRKQTLVLSSAFPAFFPAGEQEPEWTFGQSLQAGG